MNKDNLIEFAKEQCEIFPEDSYMGKYLRETLKMLQAEPCKDAVEWSIKEMKALADPKNTILEFDEKMGLKTAMNILLRNIGYAPDTNVGSKADGMTKEPTAYRRYRDLLEYFGDDSILEDDEEFKKWLERIKWHVRKANELYQKYECQAEPCEDAISREGVIKVIDHHTFDTDDGLCLDEDISIILEELPPVKPVACIAKVNFSKEDMQEIVDKKVEEMVIRKKGKWINKSHTSGCGIKFVASECTCCGKKTFFDCDQLVYNYCPNCGAEMESEEE